MRLPTGWSESSSIKSMYNTAQIRHAAGWLPGVRLSARKSVFLLVAVIRPDLGTTQPLSQVDTGDRNPRDEADNLPPSTLKV